MKDDPLRILVIIGFATCLGEQFGSWLTGLTWGLGVVIALGIVNECKTAKKR